MKLKALSIAVITALFINACNEKPKQESNEINTTETVKPASDEIIKTTTISKNGDELKLLSNNTKGTATANFNGETIELKAQKAASGYWYKNKNYELQGKGNNVELKKMAKLSFRTPKMLKPLNIKMTPDKRLT
ncbi:MAG: hypothetical protein CL526_02075 [Aequorivita sp.]|nr:hypothetical protein [Aequorivita sp.]|tara:strand:- start:51852 stop:52253 length:402 start_codon:yes stop_codon:yes gene_type:complete